MKHLITALCALTLVGLTAQADVTLRFNGIKAGDQWGGGYVNGPGMATWNSCQFNGSGECVRDGDTFAHQVMLGYFRASPVVPVWGIRPRCRHRRSIDGVVSGGLPSGVG